LSVPPSWLGNGLRIRHVGDGPLTFGKKEEQDLPRARDSATRDFSEDTAIKIDQEVKEIVTGSIRARQEDNRRKSGTLIRLAEALLERESLDAVEIRRIVAGLPLDEDHPRAAASEDQRPQIKEPAQMPLKPILPPITGGNPAPA